jgi:hypothetical protein
VCGSRLCCQLVSQSHIALRYHRSDIPGRWCSVFTLRDANGSNKFWRPLAIHFHRNRDRLSTGVAVREALSQALNIPCSQNPDFKRPCPRGARTELKSAPGRRERGPQTSSAAGARSANVQWFDFHLAKVEVHRLRVRLLGSEIHTEATCKPGR